MHKIICLILSLTMLCSCNLFDSELALNNAFLLEGVIYNSEQEPIDSVKIKIISVDASEGHNSLSKVDTEELSDEQGNYAVGLGCGTTWTVNFFTKEKTYTQYIQSITLEFSKDGYTTLVKEFILPDLEDTYINEDITLSQQ